MGPVQQLISDKLQAEYQPDVLQLTNESFMHSVPEGSESHFKLVIVSDRFQGLRLVQRHQGIYGLLAEQLAGPVHALALHTYTVAEWAEQSAGAPDSPNCLGGSQSKLKSLFDGPTTHPENLQTVSKRHFFVTLEYLSSLPHQTPSSPISGGACICWY